MTPMTLDRCPACPPPETDGIASTDGRCRDCDRAHEARMIRRWRSKETPGRPGWKTFARYAARYPENTILHAALVEAAR